MGLKTDMTEKRYCIQVLGKNIEVIVIDTGRGINAVIAGGDSLHIGAVSIKQPGEELVRWEFPGHRDSTVSDRWAAVLSDRYNSAAVVTCGIHYDNISRDQIMEVVEALERLLGEITGQEQAEVKKTI